MEFPLGDGSTLMFLRDSGEAVILPDFNNLDALTVPEEYINGGKGLARKKKENAENGPVLDTNGKSGTEVVIGYADANVVKDVDNDISMGKVHHGRTKPKQEVCPVKGISITGADIDCTNGCAVSGGSKRIPMIARLVECSSQSLQSSEVSSQQNKEQASLTDEAVEDVSEFLNHDLSHATETYDKDATSKEQSSDKRGFKSVLKSLFSFGDRRDRCKN